MHETDSPGCGVTVTAELSAHLVGMCRDTNTASEAHDCRNTPEGKSPICIWKKGS